MAIYHYSAQVVSRASGGSSVAKAAYRTGQNLTNERTAQIHDYTKKQVAEHTIFAPGNAPEWAKKTATLWNAVEAAEKRKDAQLCREVNVTLPAELTKEQAVALANKYGRWLANKHGTVVEVSVHRDNPKDRFGNKKPPAERGYHFHAMETLRVIGPEGFGDKAVSQKVFKGPAGPAEAKRRMQEERETWAEFANAALAKAGHSARIDHRSLEAQGIDRTPEPTLGVAVSALNRKGEPSHVMDRINTQKLLVKVDQVIEDLIAERDQVQAKITHQEKANEQQQRNRARNRRAGRTDLQHVQSVDAIRTLGSEQLLPNPEREHLDQHKTDPAPHAVHKLDAEGAARELIGKLTPAQLADLHKTLEDGSRRVREEAARKATAAQQQAEREAAIKATADREQQARAAAEQKQKWGWRDWQSWHERGAQRRAGTPNRIVGLGPTVIPRPIGLDVKQTQQGKAYLWQTGVAAGKVACVQKDDRISASGKYTPGKCRAMAEVARANNWKQVTLTGTDEFKAMALPEMLKRGIHVSNPELQPQVTTWQAEAERQRQVAQPQPVATQATPNRTPPASYEERMAALRQQRKDDIEKAKGETEFKARMKEREAPAPTPSPSKPLVPPQAIPTIVGDQPPPVVKPITELMQAETDLNSKIRKLGEEERAAAPVDKGNHAWQLKRWTDEAWAQAGATVDVQLRAAHPKAGIPANWENNLDSARGIQQMHLQEKRPRFMNGDYDARTEHNSAAVASWEKLVNERVEKARAVAQSIYDKKVDAHEANEAEKARNLITISKERGALIEQRNALSKELEKRRPEVQAVHEAERQRIKSQSKSKSNSHGIPTPSKGRGGMCD